MKTKSNKKLKALVLTAVASASLIGCSSNSNNGTALLDQCNTEVLGNSLGVCISVQPENISLSDTVKISVADTNLVSIYDWNLTWKDTGEKVTNCSGNASELNCQFDRGGEIIVNLTGTSRAGEQITVRRLIKVVDNNAPKNQAPRIVASLKNSSGTEVASFATDQYQQDARKKVEFGNYTLDFSGTHDDRDALSALKFQVSYEGGAYQNSGATFTRDIQTFGAHRVKVKATDAEGLATVLSFSIVVVCKDSSGNALDSSDLEMDDAALSISAGAEPNDFVYSVNTSLIHLNSDKSYPSNVSVGDFEIRFDFNGDGILDDFPSAKQNGTYSKTERSLFGSTRKIGVNVLDNKCGLDRTFNNFERALDIDHAVASNVYNSGQLSVTGAQSSVMQAIVRQGAGKPGSSAAALYKDIYDRSTKDVDFVSHWSTGMPQRVECDYRGGNNPLTVAGKYQYVRDGDPTTVEYGMSLRVTGLSEVRSGSTSVTTTTAATIDRASYFTDTMKEAFPQLTFTKNGACAVKTRIEGVLQPPGCCGPLNPDGSCDRPYDVWLYTIQGAFGCEKLTATTGGQQFDVSLGYVDSNANKEGAYYCQVQLIEGSCGGGGGGGGTVIPQ